MKVILIYAKSQAIREKAAAIFSDDKAVKGELARDEIYPPLGIAILAAELEQKGYEVRLLDDSIEEIETLREGMEWADVVGISSLTPNARRARELGKIARDEIGRFVVMGGPHPTTNPEFFLEARAADICVQGEGDLTLPEILERKDRPETWDEIQGITFMRDGAQVATPRRALVKKVDDLPFPAYHLYDIPKYMRLMVNPGVTLITSRGCPYACTFCDAEMTPRQYRAMNPERTVDLMEFLIKKYNPPQLVLFDDLFTIQRKRVIAVCQEIVRRGLYFEWICESRLDTMDFEMLRWMRKAGCVKIYYGLESGSPKLLVTMKKGLTTEKILSAAKLNRSVGMWFKYFLIYGFPNETMEDHLETQRVVRDTRPNSICVSLLQPIPGTEVYEQLKPMLTQEVAEIEFHYWHSTETFKHPVWTHDELRAEREELLKLHARTVASPKNRLLRKWERLSSMVRHPVLFGDWLEIRRRRKTYRSRVRGGVWRQSLERSGRDRVGLQVPHVSVD
ncbi:MAG TPA: radical SAM protein, partial [Planctomycetota bacterium]|nr:radical SAM protein [Planctomycetota bacterium]